MNDNIDYEDWEGDKENSITNEILLRWMCWT